MQPQLRNVETKTKTFLDTRSRILCVAFSAALGHTGWAVTRGRARTHTVKNAAGRCKDLTDWRCLPSHSCLRGLK